MFVSVQRGFSDELVGICDIGRETEPIEETRSTKEQTFFPLSSLENKKLFNNETHHQTTSNLAIVTNQLTFVFTRNTGL